MALLFLPNTAASVATSVGMIDGATADGFSLDALATGARSRLWRSTSTTGTKTPGYSFGASVPCDYIVVARADYLLTKEGTDVTPAQRSSGGTWTTYGDGVYAPLDSGDLIGPRGQDLVIPISPTQTHGLGISCALRGSSAQAAMFSKLFGCASFTLGQEPELLSWDALAVGAQGYPKRSLEPYEIEYRWTLGFSGIESDDLTDFRGMSQVVNWPLFLFDTTGDLWEWQLEHVIVEDLVERIEPDGAWALELTVARLRHYD